MKNYILLLILISSYLLPLSLEAQKNDNVWIFGSRNNDEDRGTKMTFLPSTTILNKIYTDEDNLPTKSNTSMCDDEGNFLFYATPWNVLRPDYSIMPNGQLSTHSSEGVPQMIIALTDPGKEDGYYLFRTGATLSKSLSYSYIDMSLDEEKGEVTIKHDTILAVEYMMGGVHAVKHSNGRDWWLINHNDKTTEHYVILIDADGPKLHHTQNIGLPPSQKNFGVESFHFKFSPNGKYYAMTSDHNGVRLYDFDRSTGMLSNFRMRESMYVGPKSLEFSPSSEMLYFSEGGNIYQVKLSDFGDQSKEVELFESIELFDRIGVMTLAPNCKIYVSGQFSLSGLHVIHQPNTPGLACDFRFLDRDFEGMLTGRNSVPNHPNFRIDQEDYCAEIAMNSEENELTKIRISPNPARDYITLKGLSEHRLCLIEIYNSEGLKVFSSERAKEERINISHLIAGTYIVNIYLPNASSTSRKFIKI